MKIVSKKDFIWIIDGMILDKQCDAVIDMFNQRQKDKLVFNRVDFEGAHAHQKKDEATSLRRVEDMEVEVKDLLVNLTTAFKKYAEETGVMEAVGNNLYFDVPKIQKTLPGGGYHLWHCEKTNMVEAGNRVLVYTVYLNDNFEGGETEFLHQSVRCTPKKGRICIFPAAFPYLHRGNPPLSGEKYILTSWIRNNYINNYSS